jgi:hypothetical protein
MHEADKRFTVFVPADKTHFTVSDLLAAIVALRIRDAQQAADSCLN